MKHLYSILTDIMTNISVYRDNFDDNYVDIFFVREYNNGYMDLLDSRG